MVKLRDAYEASWREVINECHEAGLIQGDQSLQRHMALGSLNWTVQWYRPEGKLSPDELAKELVAMVLRE